MLQVKKILCPIDFSDPSYEALSAADDLASRFSAELVLLHVVPIAPIVPGLPSTAATFNVPLYQQELEASSKAMMVDAIDRWVSKDVAAQPIIITGDPPHHIARIVEEEKIDLLVMSTHGQTGWRRIFGSVADKVIKLASCPVLLIRTRPPAENTV
jgi:nucleotide-binding universal stress UspA family protein